MIGSFEQFEYDVMKRIITENIDLVDRLEQQFDSATVVSRKFTGFGFYTNYDIKDKNSRLKDASNLELGNVQAKLDGLKYGMGFVLFIRDGLIKTLEGYTYEEPLPSQFSKYSIN